jgi:prepilin-type N-terminal cleavage/methylation domain-containing protein
MSKIKQSIAYGRHGFTLIEVLVVIAVIGILAVIGIVVYTNVQRDARNANTIAMTKQIVNSFSLYRLTYKTNPANTSLDPDLASGGYCLTLDNKCSNFEGTNVTTNNATLMNELKKVSSIPEKGAPLADGNYYGIYLDYNEVRTINGVPRPFLIMYRLEGRDRKCSLPNLIVDSGFAAGRGAGADDVRDADGNLTLNPYVSATTPWSYSGYGGVNTTECWVTVE